MNKKQRKLEKILQYFLKDIPIDQKTKLRSFTKFDHTVVDMIRELQNQFADKFKSGYIISDECKRLGFVLQEGSGIAGCSTIPCFGGKMPYQSEPIVGCAIGRTMCDISPINSIRESKKFEKLNAELKEKVRLEKNAKARAKYKEKKVAK